MELGPIFLTDTFLIWGEENVGSIPILPKLSGRAGLGGFDTYELAEGHGSNSGR